MLRHLVHVEGVRSEKPLVLVLLHGRGSNEEDLQGLGSLLPPGTILVTPRAPHEAAPWGYGPGWAWYRYLEEDRVDRETLERSLAEMDRLLGGIPATLGVDPGPMVLGGFSQGGTTSLAWALTRRDRVVGVANLSGFLMTEPEFPLDTADGLPVFWAHGERDPAIPFSLARKGRQRLSEAGARLRTFDHPGGHQVTREEMDAFREWLEAISGRAAEAAEEPPRS